MRFQCKKYDGFYIGSVEWVKRSVVQSCTFLKLHAYADVRDVGGCLHAASCDRTGHHQDPFGPLCEPMCYGILAK